MFLLGVGSGAGVSHTSVPFFLNLGLQLEARCSRFSFSLTQGLVLLSVDLGLRMKRLDESGEVGGWGA